MLEKSIFEELSFQNVDKGGFNDLDKDYFCDLYNEVSSRKNLKRNERAISTAYFLNDIKRSKRKEDSYFIRSIGCKSGSIEQQSNIKNAFKFNLRIEKGYKGLLCLLEKTDKSEKSRYKNILNTALDYSIEKGFHITNSKREYILSVIRFPHSYGFVGDVGKEIDDLVKIEHFSEAADLIKKIGKKTDEHYDYQKDLNLEYSKNKN